MTAESLGVPNTGGGKQVALDTIGGISHPLQKQAFGDENTATRVTPSTPFPSRSLMGGHLIQALPAGSANGAALATPPAPPADPAPAGIRFFLQSADASFTYVRSAALPTGAPAAGTTNTVSKAEYGPYYDEPIAKGILPYITAKTGSVSYMYI